MGKKSVKLRNIFFRNSSLALALLPKTKIGGERILLVREHLTQITERRLIIKQFSFRIDPSQLTLPLLLLIFPSLTSTRECLIHSRQQTWFDSWLVKPVRPLFFLAANLGCRYVLTRPIISQFKSLKIRRLAILMLFRNVVRDILNLQSCERVGRGVASIRQANIFTYAHVNCTDKHTYIRTHFVKLATFARSSWHYCF